MELAHRLAVSEQPYIREIRDKLIVLINPAAEPDGRDRMVDWFYRHLKGKTDFENLPPLSPPYWGKYVRPRQQPRRHPAQARAHARDAGRVPQVAAAGDARPARVGAALVDLDRDRPLQPEPRSERLQRVAHDRVPGGGDAHGDGAAGRLDLRLRRGLRAGLPGLARDQPQRHQPRLRDLRQRHGRDRRAHDRPRAQPLDGPRRHRARLVPDGAAAEEAQVVAAQQHQLHGDGRARRAPVRRAQQLGDAPQLLAARGERRSRRARPRSPMRSPSPRSRTTVAASRGS